jgi:hypothetical protein
MALTATARANPTAGKARRRVIAAPPRLADDMQHGPAARGYHVKCKARIMVHDLDTTSPISIIF